MVLGRESHEEIVEDFEKIELEEIWKLIHSKGTVKIAEMTLLARYKNIVIVGRPDLLIFKDGAPIMIFEYKFSKYKIPFSSRHLQAQAYGIILRELGFDTSFLFYAIVVVPPEMKQEMDFLKKIPNLVLDQFIEKALVVQDESTLALGDVKVFVFKFDSTQPEERLDWALKFWKCERESIKTDNANKCNSCDYKEHCN